MLGSREVQGVVIAVITVASLAGVALTLNMIHHDEFDGMGLLNSECMIGNYPSTVVVPSNVTLCLFIENHRNSAGYYKIVYKITTNKTLPSREKPSPEPVLRSWRLVLPPLRNTTMKVVVPVTGSTVPLSSNKIALVFELWRYDSRVEDWVYTGRWVHLYVTPTHEIIPGG